MTRIEDALNGVSRLGLDTAPVIYFVEANPQYDSRIIDIFQRISDGAIGAVTSTITLLEGLVLPIRQGDPELAQRYRTLLLGSDNLEIVPVTADVAEIAADLRARYNLRTPDALQMAACLSAGCEAFLTNDQQLTRVTELKVLTLDELLP